MRNHMRNDLPNDVDYDRGRGSWMVPLILLVALAIGGLIYAFSDGTRTTASNPPAPSASTTGSGAGTGMSGEQTGAAVTQTPAGAATGGGGAASR
jgi:hypothetical protein